MLLIYNFLSLICLVLYSPWLLLKKGPESRITYLRERLGTVVYDKTDIWIHAVSVGEVMAALPFLRALKKEFPQTHITLSTTTYTGQKIARDKFPSADRIMYVPWDTGVCVRKAVRSLNPSIFITVETELWPVLFSSLNKSGSKVVVLNGRLSRNSFKGYTIIRSFMAKALSNVDHFYMQESGDMQRILSLGAIPDRVSVMGNFKFDMEFKEVKDIPSWISRLYGLVMVAGSTHEGEEEIILDAYESAKDSINDLKLILVPRHPERFNEVEGILRKRQLDFIRRSQIEDNGKLPDVILLDTMGELPKLYSRADIAFIGGSLLPFGGHNVLEPAYWSKPLVFGPHMDNFPIADVFLKEGAALMVKDSQDLAESVKHLLSDAETARQTGMKAKAIVERNRGAVAKAIDLVRSCLPKTQ